MSGEAARLFAMLAEGLGQEVHPETVDASRLAGNLRRHVDQGLWAPEEWPELAEFLAGTNHRIIGDPGRQYNHSLWEAVCRAYRRIRPDAVTSQTLDTILVETLSSGVPGAFSTRAGDEYLIVVDNFFHDFLYHLVKLMVVAWDPLPAPGTADPAWRPAGAPRNLREGRLEMAARSLRVALGMIRRNGRMSRPVQVLLPTAMSLHAGDFTDRAQYFILAHEAAHILLGHHAAEGRRLGVGGVEVSAGQCDHSHGIEEAADLLAARALMEIEWDDENPLSREFLATQSAHLFLGALHLYEEAYYIVPPVSHPHPITRVNNVLRKLSVRADSPRELVHPIFDAPILNTFERLALASVSAEIHERPFDDYIRTIAGSPHFHVDDPGSHELAYVDILEAAHIGGQLANVLALIAETLAEPRALRRAVRALSEPLAALAAERPPPEALAHLVKAEFGRRIVLSDTPIFVQLRQNWQPEPGTPFHSWAAGLPGFSDLVLDTCTEFVSVHVARNGPDALAVLTSEAERVVEEWLTGP
ncbi:hypothetical protein [Longispora albida]|uniref:hypothetical protein n=1 Tax=Longispora albida TaxID=203523 RepID=UPI0003AA8A5B|nr:hypothetical protein [Longispora albida]